MQQGFQTCSQYLGQSKSWDDQLMAVGKPVEDDDLISYILGRLNPTYATFITLLLIIACELSMSFQDFQVELLNYETLLETQYHNIANSSNFVLYMHKPKPSGSNFKGKGSR